MVSSNEKESLGLLRVLGITADDATLLGIISPCDDTLTKVSNESRPSHLVNYSQSEEE